MTIETAQHISESCRGLRHALLLSELNYQDFVVVLQLFRDELLFFYLLNPIFFEQPVSQFLPEIVELQRSRQFIGTLDIRIHAEWSSA